MLIECACAHLEEKHLVRLHRTGGHTTSEIAELVDVARTMVDRAIQRDGERRDV